MATFNNEQFEPLPFMGANMHLRGWLPVLRHERPTDTKQYVAHIDEDALTAHREDVRRQRSKIYEESDYHTPIELYAKYPMFEHRNKFLVAETADGKWLADLGMNWLYVNDAAELAVLTGRTIDRNFLATKVQPTTPQGEQEYAAQLERLDEKYAAKVVEYEPHQSTATVYEVYDSKMQLLAICPNSLIAEREFGVPHSTLADAARNRNLCHGKYYFREFYDNSFTIKNNFPFEQIQDGRVVNRFPTVKDAAELLNIQPFAIYRMIRESHKVDQYGCHWRKNKG